MSEPFLIALRESFQCSILLALALFYPPIRRNGWYVRSLVFGVLAAFLIGFPLGWFPRFGKDFIANDTWTVWRYVAESAVFYSSVLLLIRRPSPRPATVVLGLFTLGFLLFFFESHAVGFIIHDMGVMNEKVAGTLAAGMGGVVLGFLPLVLLRRIPEKLPSGENFTAPSLLMITGSFQFWFGGVRELENENILAPLQRTLLHFISEAVRSAQQVLLIPGHSFLKVDWTGLADYLAGDRIAMTLAVLFLTAPPVIIMVRLFARPDPLVDDIGASARRRQTIAAFRKEMSSLAAPVLAAFVILIVLLHAVNMSLNPLYDPAPIPVREAGREPALRLPVTSKFGDMGDKKLRKFVYFHGSREVLFIVIMKPDGSLGVALDQCEICRPADWNTDARGYAQKGENLMCKYCVTPIATNSVNTPGGCNPIPLPFEVVDGAIVIRIDELISTFDRAEALERKGTHL